MYCAGFHFMPLPTIYFAELYAFNGGTVSGVQNPVDKKVTLDSAPLRGLQGHLGLGDSGGHLLRGPHGALQCRVCQGGSPDNGLGCDCGGAFYCR